MNFRKLKVYQLALEVVPILVGLAETLPRGCADLADELRRAGFSVPRNIAEGSGKRTKRNQQRYYGDARASAMECAAVLDSTVAVGYHEREDVARADDLLTQIVKGLSKMCLPEQPG